MGFRFIKSKKIGKLFRLNFSKSGVGASFGNKFFRIGITPKGQIRKTFTLPKTGISYTTYSKSKKKK
ncbi:DUF4236 domain-containing protein [uncultured Tyzzerella sp.]|uniref:DUF4236 domain-containing protein n=1 Tax=uncultured Tyzzerella sp. TaxID=2321398 RepID=UPI0029434BAE|nr:DUF4236 domain-containing protein [uncultured Tyzzerella sp.]